VLQDWKVPQVVVVGNESIGKSTLLERLAMMPLFPRGERRCTRMKVEIRLRRGADKNPSLKLFRIEPNGDDVVEKSIEVAMETGSEGIQKEMFSLINPNPDMPQICPNKYLVMEITNRSAPNIDLVDMPGMISTPEEEASLIQKMITDQFEKHGEYSMYLFMMEATRNVNQSPISLIKQRPGMERNTLGVVTHVDKVDPKIDVDRFDSLKKLANGDPSPGIGGVPLEPHGFVLTMNASNEDDEFTGFSPIFQRAHREDTFFDSMGYGELVTNKRAGCKALLFRLKDMYWEYLEKQWLPKTFEKIEHEIEKWALCDTKLGLPRAHVVLSEEENVSLVSAVKSGTKKIFQDNVDSIEQQYEVECLSHVFDSLVTALQPVTLPRLKVNAHIESTKGSVASICRTFLEDVDNKFWTNEMERVLKEDTSPLQLGRFGCLISSCQRMFQEKITESNKSIMSKLERFLEAHCTDLHSVRFQTNSADRTVTVSMPALDMAESIRHILSANIHIFDSTLIDDETISVILADPETSMVESCAEERFEILHKLKLLNIAKENLQELANLQG
jgi:GTP-binding protein EngB required for normal cell division